MATMFRNNNKLSSQEGRRRYNLGKEAELAAIDYLARQGYKILNNRYRFPYGEIDIIAYKDKKITFVEVKARGGNIADDLVHPQQLQRIFDAGTFFLANYPQFDSYECQIDIIVVNKNIITEHIKGQTLD